MIARHLKALLVGFLAHRDLELKVTGTPVRGFDNFFRFAKAQGLAPATVFDVGVGHGTPWLYASFQGARFVLVEPLAEFHPMLERVCREIGGELHQIGLGAERAEVSIAFPKGGETGASVFALSDQHRTLIDGSAVADYSEQRTITIDTLDAINRYPPPYLIKLDIEGAELSALKGARETLTRTQLVILEASVLPRHQGEPSLAEIVAFLDDHGFRLIDVPDMNQAGKDGPLVYLDLAFVPKTFPHVLAGNA